MSAEAEECEDNTIAYAAPLQLQCILFLVGHLDEIPISQLALLPAKLRKELLLLLPAVDVCKLETTPVTADIHIEEIWETLHEERIMYDDELEGVPSREKRAKTFHVSLSWKEAYFQGALTINFNRNFDFSEAVYCECDHDHYLFDVLYGVFKSYDRHEFFTTASNSVQGLVRTAGQCPNFTPNRYVDIFNDRVDTEPMIDLVHLVKRFVDTCQVRIKIFDHEECDDRAGWSCLNEESQPYIAKAYASVESVCFASTKPYPEQIFDAIFINNPDCCVKTAIIVDTETLEMAARYLTNAQLTKLELIQCDFEHHMISSLVQAQPALESLMLTNECEFTGNATPPVIRKLFETASFKELRISLSTCSVESLRCIIECFLASNRSIAVSLEHITCRDAPDDCDEISKTISSNSKTMTLDECEIPDELMSLLPD